MGRVDVDQIAPGGVLVQDVDTTLSDAEKNRLLLAALPGASVEIYHGERVVRYRDQIILKKQVTHLGNPWPGFKKRIQIPGKWLAVEAAARIEGLVPRFVGIYHYRGTTIFVDFDPTTYVTRRANNSAAHVATNDLFQAETGGVFARCDRNGNVLSSVRSKEFERYLLGAASATDPRLGVFRSFNRELMDGQTVEGLDAVKEMYAANWPDTFQGEWPGFYLEFRFAEFLKKARLSGLAEFQKDKNVGSFDYDLVFRSGPDVEYYGDLKASDVVKHESPGNDAADIRRCVELYGRFWYVIYEHETVRARDTGGAATVAWNEWKRSVGYRARKAYNPLSYASRYKASVKFVKMMVLEVNPANFDLALGNFAQGQQPGGAARALKVMIKKRNIDNFLVYSSGVTS